jgi:hypothetical protein
MPIGGAKKSIKFIEIRIFSRKSIKEQGIDDLLEQLEPKPS